MLDPRNEPLRGEGRRQGYVQRPGLMIQRKIFHCLGKRGEALAHARQQALALVGQHQRALRAAEQTGPEDFFQPLDLMADCGVRDVQLIGRAGEAAVPGGGLEGAKRVQRR